MTMKSMRYYYCAVPMCRSTSVSTPDKTFIQVPADQNRCCIWMDAARRDMKKYPLSPKTVSFFCEDHFNLEEDVENYMRWKIQGVKIRLKKDVVPHKFECQGTDNSKTLLPCKRIPQSYLTETDPEFARGECIFDSSSLDIPNDIRVDNFSQVMIKEEDGVSSNLKSSFKSGKNQSPGRRTKLKRRLKTVPHYKQFNEYQEEFEESTENSSYGRTQMADFEFQPIKMEGSIKTEPLIDSDTECLTLPKDSRIKMESDKKLYIETKPLFGITSRCINSFVNIRKKSFVRK